MVQNLAFRVWRDVAERRRARRGGLGGWVPPLDGMQPRDEAHL